MKSLKNVILLLLALFLTQSISAQGWEQYITPPTIDSTFNGFIRVDKTIHDDYVVAPFVSNQQIPFMRIDTNGNSLWNTFDSIQVPIEPHLIATNDNNYVSAYGSWLWTNALDDIYLSKFNALGDTLWTVSYTNLTTVSNFWVMDITQTQDSNIVLLIQESELAPATMNFRLIKFDYDSGGILWNQTINYTGATISSSTHLQPHQLEEYPNGDLLFSASYGVFPYTNSEVLLFKTDPNGNLLSTNSYPFPNVTNAPFSKLAMNANGEIALVGHQMGDSTPVVIKIDAQFNEVWRKTIWVNGEVHDVVVEQTGEVLIAGKENDQGILKKYDAAGNIEWTHSQTTPTAIMRTYYNHIEVLDQGGYMIFGVNVRTFPTYQVQIYVARLNSNGKFFNQSIVGTIYNDANLDCIQNNGESTLPAPVIIQIVQNTDTSYAITDTAGNYDHQIAAGTYEVSAIPLGTRWTNCPPQTITLNPDSTVTQDLGLRPTSTCPDLAVNMTTPALIRCFSTIYTVTYANLGTQDETGVYIEIALDSFLIIDSASIPYTVNGNIYTFNLGTLSLGENGKFRIYTTVDCSAVLGQTHCTKATIYPNQPCLPNNIVWNGATIIADAYCADNDSVTFRLENIGPGDMIQSKNYLVIEDQILRMQGSYDLNQGEDTSFSLLANGYLYQIQADQASNHPWGNNLPSAITYGCNAGNLITNAINQLGLNDFLNFQDVDCQQNVGSYDPNDKQGFPIGYGGEFFIRKEDNIEYLIRFQNTGTYTAFNVRVEDEIDTKTLDLSTLQVQASSHDYTLEIKDGNTLVFKFDNIMLPDSGANEPASHGYIRFKINQKANNPIGTVIENFAAIYFDYNEPIITNRTIHRVAENFIRVVSTHQIDNKIAEVKVFPNPFTQQARFEITTKEVYQDIQLMIFDVTGRVVNNLQIEAQNQFILDRGNLNTGIYFYKIIGDGQILDSGKLMVR